MPIGKTTQPPPAVYHGFRQDGSLFQTDSPVNNPITNFVRDSRRSIRDGLLSPAQFLQDLAKEPPTILRAIPPAVARWGTLTSFWQWPIAQTGSPLLEAIRHFNNRLWATNERAWSDLCNSAEALHGTNPRANLIDPAILRAYDQRLQPPDPASF